MTEKRPDDKTADLREALDALLTNDDTYWPALTIPTPSELARIRAEQQARIDHELCSVPCEITYPGSDGIPRTTSAELTTDHPQSSYGLPVIVVNRPSDDAPLDPVDAALLDAMTAPGVHLTAGSMAEALADGVYGVADLPAGSTIRLHSHRADTAVYDVMTGTAPVETYEQMEARITHLREGARRAGYTIVDRFGR